MNKLYSLLIVSTEYNIVSCAFWQLLLLGKLQCLVNRFFFLLFFFWYKQYVIYSQRTFVMKEVWSKAHGLY